MTGKPESESSSVEQLLNLQNLRKRHRTAEAKITRIFKSLQAQLDIIKSSVDNGESVTDSCKQLLNDPQVQLNDDQRAFILTLSDWTVSLGSLSRTDIGREDFAHRVQKVRRYLIGKEIVREENIELMADLFGFSVEVGETEAVRLSEENLQKRIQLLEVFTPQGLLQHVIQHLSKGFTPEQFVEQIASYKQGERVGHFFYRITNFWNPGLGSNLENAAQRDEARKYTMLDISDIEIFLNFLKTAFQENKSIKSIDLETGSEVAEILSYALEKWSKYQLRTMIIEQRIQLRHQELIQIGGKARSLIIESMGKDSDFFTNGQAPGPTVIGNLFHWCIVLKGDEKEKLLPEITRIARDVHFLLTCYNPEDIQAPGWRVSEEILTLLGKTEIFLAGFSAGEQATKAQ